MNLPSVSVEFMMIAARGIVLLLALATLAWAILRWRRDTTRDAQRMFEQLDLVRAELLQLQGQMGSASPVPPAIAQYQNQQAAAHAHYAATSTSAAKPAGYPDFESERKAMVEARRPANETVNPKSRTNAAPRGYEVASRLARNGATVEELVNTCALSRHEAELMVRLHAGMKSTQLPSAKQDARNVAANSNSRAHANLNQLKNIGSRANAAPAKPAAQNVNRTAPTARPANHQRVSLVG
ncbi:MAG TPA: DUF2802 domain-containing protein [Steroidobacteraceae bacterium]|nr:DUF2802 domain-containing protein [Steroidobacteraceae bacterium]